MKYKNANQKLLILIVDDNMSFVERMVGILNDVRDIGYINVASDYSEALKYFSEEKPDLVFLDINLPGRNGIDLLKEIRFVGHPCKIIMLTNHSEEYYKQQCQEWGADHFLDKSSDFAKVPEIIEELNWV